MPEFEDVTLLNHYRPNMDYSLSMIERVTVLLKDGETTATIYPIHSADELPDGLLHFLCDEFNMEVERGDTQAFFDNLLLENFQNYWFGSFAAVMVLGDDAVLDRPRQWEKECLGTFLIKPNYPGRSSHICTANFLVNAGIRNKGIGRTLTECFLEWSPRLGYTHCVFNLVFETNFAAKKLFDSLSFKRIGKIKAAGILKGHESAVDAIIYEKELSNLDDNSSSYRFDKIRFYLETGKYPPMANRQEKSRLRSAASHYQLENDKLILHGKEVISDPVKQINLCRSCHLANQHAGINKTTALITEKYHWNGIKNTVIHIVKNCQDCKDPVRASIKRAQVPKFTTNNKSVNSAMAQYYQDVSKPKPQDNINNNTYHSQMDATAASLLSGELSIDDSGIMAAVQLVQQQQQQQQQRQQQHHHHQQQQQQQHHQHQEQQHHQQPQQHHHQSQQQHQQHKQQDYMHQHHHNSKPDDLEQPNQRGDTPTSHDYNDQRYTTYPTFEQQTQAHQLQSLRQSRRDNVNHPYAHSQEHVDVVDPEAAEIARALIQASEDTQTVDDVEQQVDSQQHQLHHHMQQQHAHHHNHHNQNQHEQRHQTQQQQRQQHEHVSDESNIFQ